MLNAIKDYRPKIGNFNLWWAMCKRLASFSIGTPFGIRPGTLAILCYGHDLALKKLSPTSCRAFISNQTITFCRVTQSTSATKFLRLHSPYSQHPPVLPPLFWPRRNLDGKAM